MNRVSWRSAAPALLACAVACTASPAWAQNALTVVRDAETGKLRAPTPDEARALAGATSLPSTASSSRGVVSGSLTPIHRLLPNGTVMHEATEDTLSASVVVRGKDGKLVRQCAGSLAAAERIAQGKRVSFAKNMLERHDAIK